MINKTKILTYNSIGHDMDLSWNSKSDPGIRPMRLIFPKNPGENYQLGVYFFGLDTQGEWEHKYQIFDIKPEDAKILLNKTTPYSKVESTIWPYLTQIYDDHFPSCPFPTSLN